MNEAIDIRIFDDIESLAQEAASAVVEAYQGAIVKHGTFQWVLAGGGTPKRCYELLRDAPINWSDVEVYFGDERCLPRGDSERNDTMAAEALFSHVDIPDENIHCIAAELGARAAADAYDLLLSNKRAPDLVLLGMGEDGHTASLFPGHHCPDDRLAIAVFEAPKPPPERVSMSFKAINRAAKKIIMSAGVGKREAFDRIKQGEKLPAGNIETPIWFVDSALLN